MAINWSMLDTNPNIFAKTVAGVEAGAKAKTERDTRAAMNLFAQDPSRGGTALIAAGRPDLARDAFSARKSGRAYQAEEAARPFTERGDFMGAAKAAGGVDIETGGRLQSFNKEQLSQLRDMNTRGAEVIMAASRLASPEERRAFIDGQADELAAYGYPVEKIRGYDVSDPMRMRADASSKMSLAEQAGKISVEKFGDYAVTYETNPVTGSRAVSKSEIPMTRAERRQDEEFSYRRQHDAEELDLARRREARMSASESDPAGSPSKVMGPIYAKLARGEPLTPGERQAMLYYRLDPLTADAVGEDDDVGAAERPPQVPAPAPSPAPPARPGSGRPGNGRSSASPVQPRSRAEAEALPSGTWFRDPAGNLIQKR